MTVKFELSYGISEIIGYRMVERSWIREERYTSKSDGFSALESNFCTGKDDVSPPHSLSVGKGYNPDCSLCWLNISHTVDAHNQGLNKQE